MSKIIVIGAGITGITTAYSLVRRGYQVTVIEAEPYAAMKTSYANGGQLSVSNSEVWTTWSNIAKAANWILTDDAPLLINLKPSWAKINWMSKFLFHTIMNRHESNTVKTINLALRARELYFAIADEESISFDLKKEGILHFYKNQQYFEQAKKSCILYQKNGVDRHVISLDNMVEIEPALADSNDIVGATYTAGDATGDIHKFCIELSQVLQYKYGVNFHYNTNVSSIENLGTLQAVVADQNSDSVTFTADHVVICGGVSSASLAKLVEDNVPVYPVKGYSITISLLDKKEQEAAPYVSLLDDEAKIVTSRLGNRLRVAGTAELADYNLDIRQDRVDPLINWVRKNFPAVSTEHVVPWAGLRPMTPDMLPIVRQSTKKCVWFNTGHGHLGWTLSAATAELLADQIDKNQNL